jgi:antibiotic biosynthesis monooxygenase (ABM) superfamily enzyme
MNSNTTGTGFPTRVEAAAPTRPAAPAGPPSVHVRAVITWLAIFPLVALGMLVIAPFSESWHPVLRAFVLTLVVVPLAVYLVVPQLMRVYGRTRTARAARRGNA